jgi:hypothetical protein
MGPGLFVYSASQLWRVLACLSLDGNGLDATGANPRRERTCLCKVSYEAQNGSEYTDFGLDGHGSAVQGSLAMMCVISRIAAVIMSMTILSRPFHFVLLCPV